MEIPVVLEQVGANCYRATAMGPVPLVVEAATRDLAVEQFRGLMAERLSKTEVIRVEIATASEPNPWLAIAGSWQNHEDIEEVERAIRSYRQEIDADQNRV